MRATLAFNGLEETGKQLDKNQEHMKRLFLQC